jgi:hypothetical protein
MSQDIYVVIEHLRGQVADISYTMLVAAQLAQATDGRTVAVLRHNAKDVATIVLLTRFFISSMRRWLSSL